MSIGTFIKSQKEVLLKVYKDIINKDPDKNVYPIILEYEHIQILGIFITCYWKIIIFAIRTTRLNGGGRVKI